MPPPKKSNKQWGVLQPVLKVDWVTSFTLALHMGELSVWAKRLPGLITFGLQPGDGSVLRRSVICLLSKALREETAFPEDGGGSRGKRPEVGDIVLGGWTPASSWSCPMAWLALGKPHVLPGPCLPSLGQVRMNANPFQLQCVLWKRGRGSVT